MCAVHCIRCGNRLKPIERHAYQWRCEQCELADDQPVEPVPDSIAFYSARVIYLKTGN